MAKTPGHLEVDCSSYLRRTSCLKRPRLGVACCVWKIRDVEFWVIRRAIDQLLSQQVCKLKVKGAQRQMPPTYV